MPTRGEEIAWAAGLFEGEGSAGGKGLRRGGQAKLASTDYEVVDRFWGIIGRGRVYGPYQPKRAGSKPFMVWAAGGKEDIQHLLLLIGDWLSPRRAAQLETALEKARSTWIPRYEGVAPPIGDKNCGRYIQVVPGSSGYRRHRYKNEPACEMCLSCLSLYNAEKKKLRAKAH